MTVFRRELPLSRIVGSPAGAGCHIEPTRVPPDRAEVVRRAGISSLTSVLRLPLRMHRNTHFAITPWCRFITAQMKPTSSRAQAVTATLRCFPLFMRRQKTLC